MANAHSDSDNSVCKNISKKRKTTGRMSEVMKKLRLQGHEEGKPCNCKRLKCYERLGVADRKFLLKNFNALSSNDLQNSYLCGLIAVIPVRRRRSRKPEEEANFHQATFSYKIRLPRGETAEEIVVCAKAFQSLHGISKEKLEYLQRSLKFSGTSPKDQRGKHSSKHRKLKQQIFDAVYQHIDSFRGRKSHYSLHDSKKKYLPETLNIKKMYRMFVELYPDIKVSYESYKYIFNTKFNLAFGYPRTDTCSSCDEFQAKIKMLTSAQDEEELNRLKTLNELHKRKAQTFYDRKRTARLKAKKCPEVFCVALDFQKNVYLPNVSTNDVYYRRQLTMLSFNIHVLSTGQSIFYTYPETVAKKGPNEVVSFLFHFIINYVPNTVKHFHIFCDGAGGQNKNYVMIRFLHYMVHKVKKFDTMQITFPERRHSYLECDKNMGNINLKHSMEVPNEWYDPVSTSRNNPSPFNVVEVTQDMVKSWDCFFKERFVKKCPFPIQKVKEIQSTKNHPRMILQRSAYNASWEQSIIKPSKSKNTFLEDELPEGQFHLPNRAYQNLLPIKADKYNDLMVLKKFCGSDAAAYFTDLPHL